MKGGGQRERDMKCSIRGVFQQNIGAWVQAILLG